MNVFVYLMLAFILFSSACVLSQESYDDISIGGLLIDETLTKGGHDFYSLFYERINDFDIKKI